MYNIFCPSKHTYEPVTTRNSECVICGNLSLKILTRSRSRPHCTCFSRHVRQPSEYIASMESILRPLRPTPNAVHAAES